MYELGLWFPLLGSGRTLYLGHDHFITCIVWKDNLENNLGSASLHPNCNNLLLLHHFCQARGSVRLLGPGGAGSTRALVQFPAVFALTQPMEFCLEVEGAVQLCLWPSECSLPPLFPAAGSSEPAGDGNRGCALHGHPGEMCPSLLQQVRSNSPSRPCSSYNPSLFPKKPWGFSQAPQRQVAHTKASVGNCSSFSQELFSF